MDTISDLNDLSGDLSTLEPPGEDFLETALDEDDLSTAYDDLEHAVAGIDNRQEDFCLLSDEEAVALAGQGNVDAQEYLITKYKNFVRAKARSYFLIGADKEDIIQEGMIGLYKAIRDFRPDKLSSFRAFAELCITRQIITAIKTATRQKHIPLNSYVSLNKPIYDEDSDRTLLDVISGTRITDPEELIISREEFDDIESKMGEILSSLEWKVLMFYLEGKSYQEIACDLNRHVKSIDNALQRVKRKLERYLENREQDR
ncbi:MAG: RNA polymerase sporulation sigma factor SigH [Firmicutes bacterium]|nr:RNA polymerase sporulation sigma factor SigH [Bacillota bacterium]